VCVFFFSRVYREADLATQLREAKKSSLDEEMRAIERHKQDGEYHSSMDKQRQLGAALTAQLEAKVCAVQA
jgi:hypothetical protein